MGQLQRNRFGSPGLRLVQLYILMASSGRPYSLTRLASLLSCSRQTILRMMDQIQRIPDISYETWMNKNERYFQVTSTNIKAHVLFTPEVLRHLSLCSDIVSHLLPDDLRNELKKTLNAALHDPSGLLEKSVSLA